MPMKLLAAAAAFLALTGASVQTATAAGLLDGAASVTNNGPSPTTVALGPATGSTTGTIDLSGFVFGFTQNTVSFTNPYGPDSYTYVPSPGVNDFVVTFSGVPTITGVTNDPLSQLDPVAITFGGDWIAFNVSGLARYPGQTSIFDVSFANAVPEPGTWTLMLVGVAGLGAMARSRRGRSAARA